MSTTTTTHETVSTDASTTTDGDSIATIVAQAVDFKTLRDFDIYREVCIVVQDSVEIAATEDI